VHTLTTIAVCWIVASYVIAIAIPADQLLRPRSEWEAAGRNRRFWVTVTMIMSLHGLGPYAAAAYLYNVRPRLRAVAHAAAGRRPELARAAAGTGPEVEHAAAVRHGERTGAAVAARWASAFRGHAKRYIARAEPTSAAEELTIVVALLMFASSLIHAAVTAGHFAEYWLFGVLFAVVSIGQAMWTAQVYSKPLNARLLAAGAVANIALVSMWAVTRTTGLPFGPHPNEPEPIGPADTMAVIDQLLTVLVIGVMLVCMRRRVGRLPRPVLALVIALAGAVWLFSVMSPFANGNAH
jgi:hypothetical protein